MADNAKVVALVVFSGNFGDPGYVNDPECDIVLDSELAAVELRQAGFEVTPLPDRYGGLLCHPLDDFLEAAIMASPDWETCCHIMDAVEAIVAKYGGCCHECGPVEPDHEPFADLFSGRTPMQMQ
jgi:hypothetical protein